LGISGRAATTMPRHPTNMSISTEGFASDDGR
jgi:hypothetical protein